MKKLLTVLTLMAVVMTSILATTTKIQIETNVVEVEAEFTLKYENRVLSGEKNEIEMGNSLTAKTSTKNFEIIVASNYNNDKKIQVDVKPGAFILQRNQKSSGITPDVKWIGEKTTYIPAGLHSTLLVRTFNLNWDGTGKIGLLDAGKYTSNVTIEYKVN